MDTLGSLIDKLITIDMKMWVNQESLYDIRRMSFDDFKTTYIKSKDGPKRLFEILSKCCDLNVQRNQNIDEIDQILLKIIHQALSGGPESLDQGNYIQRKHKTY